MIKTKSNKKKNIHRKKTKKINHTSQSYRKKIKKIKGGDEFLFNWDGNNDDMNFKRGLSNNYYFDPERDECGEIFEIKAVRVPDTSFKGINESLCKNKQDLEFYQFVLARMYKHWDDITANKGDEGIKELNRQIKAYLIPLLNTDYFNFENRDSFTYIKPEIGSMPPYPDILLNKKYCTEHGRLEFKKDRKMKKPINVDYDIPVEYYYYADILNWLAKHITLNKWFLDNEKQFEPVNASSSYDEHQIQGELSTSQRILKYYMRMNPNPSFSPTSSTTFQHIIQRYLRTGGKITLLGAYKKNLTKILMDNIKWWISGSVNINGNRYKDPNVKIVGNVNAPGNGNPPSNYGVFDNDEHQILNQQSIFDKSIWGIDENTPELNFGNLNAQSSSHLNDLFVQHPLYKPSGIQPVFGNIGRNVHATNNWGG